MTRTTPAACDVTIDSVPWRLDTLAEWSTLRQFSYLQGIVWRDADATRHRLLAEYHTQQAALHQAQATREEPAP